MGRIGVFYGSTYGNTRKVAQMIQEALGGANVELKDVENTSPEDLNAYDILIFGTPTYGFGALQEHWADFIWELDDVDLTGKSVAIFGLGDQLSYTDSFLNAMRTLYDKVIEKGGRVVGLWPTEGYSYQGTTAVIDGKFVGLALDMDRQRDLAESRIKQWVDQLRQEIPLT
ncbi:MAG TPA: flavodoxin [Candidatus Hydrogenedentes bacterium]|mgnify:CR=1 FL=1|nr:flavodoxin [Candidatus Hydrogenedentota bacterium]HOS04401.1 flavodoxin [Candidatus Hydrogenedentota bacterium]